MNISITPELEQFVHAKVASGMYQSASELIRDALRLLVEHDEMRRKRIEHLNLEIQKGLDQIARGETISAEESEAQIEQIIREFEARNAAI